MEKLRYWMAPVALAVAWTVTAAYVLARTSQAANQPVATFVAPEVTIEVEPPAAVLAQAGHAR